MMGWILLGALLFGQGCWLAFNLGVRRERGRAERAAEEDAAEYASKRRDGMTRLNTIRIRH
jgi:hypothetical protein